MSAPSNNNTPETPLHPIERFGIIGASLTPRCYVTQDENVDVVCHHCGRPISLADKPFRKDTAYRRRLAHQIQAREKFNRWQKWGDRFISSFHLRNQEFTNLGLKKDVAVHCHDCQHPKETAILLGILLLLAVPMLIWFLATSPAPPLEAVILIVGLLILALLIIVLVNTIHFLLVLLNKPPLFPLFGRAPVIKVNEFLEGEIKLDEDGNYTAYTDLSACHGTITTELHVARSDKKRLKKYREKYKLTKHPRVQYSMGFLLFENIRAVLFANENQYFFANKSKPIRIRSGNFTKKWRRDEALFSEIISQNYRIHFSHKDERKTTPIQIIPAIVSEGTNRIDPQPNETQAENGVEPNGMPRTGLELTVQVNPKVWVKNILNSDVTIQELTIEVDESEQMDKVQAAIPPHSSESAGNQVVWKRVKLERPDEAAFYENVLNDKKVSETKKSVPSKRFFVRFTRNISPSTKLRGKLVAKFNDTLSGIDKLQLFDPLGYKIDETKYIVSRDSVITIEFSFNLSHLRIREHISPKIEPIPQDNLIPDHHIVNNIITKLISDATTYVQWVVENPPQTNQASASIENRYWDIGGREYDGVYPMNFHIMLSGQQHYEGSDWPTKGNTTIDVEISATSTSKEMTKKVLGLKKRLVGIVEQSIAEWRQDENGSDDD